MSTIATIAIIAAVVVLGIFLFVTLRRVAAERERKRERMRSDVAGHRQQSDAQVSRARELGGKVDSRVARAEEHESEAERHRVEAERHDAEAQAEREQAGELARTSERAGRSAGRHDERAAEIERKL
jgi:hypothetical protein